MQMVLQPHTTASFGAGLQGTGAAKGYSRPERAQSTEWRQRRCQMRPGLSHIPRHTEGTSGVTRVGDEPWGRGAG